MRCCDVLIVGGGPAGSSAAWELRRGGADVRVLDQEDFPRLKLCAGWITPEVVHDLEIDVATYPHRFLTFNRLHVHLKGLHLRVPAVQHSIRRFEFDAWLLERSRRAGGEARGAQHSPRGWRLRHRRRVFLPLPHWRRRHALPGVSRRCFAQPIRARAACRPSPSSMRSPTTGTTRTATCGSSRRSLPGYAWYVPKANGWLNVGIGGMAERMKNSGHDIKYHWTRFTRALDRKLAPRAAVRSCRLQLLPARPRRGAAHRAMHS